MFGGGLAPRVPRRGLFAFLACLSIVLATLCSPSRAASSVTAHVERHGERIVIDISATFGGSLEEAWDVLTDYNHMATFLGNITSSAIVSRRGNSLVVRQSGGTTVGFFRFRFAAVRAVDLVPMKQIDTTLISGDFKSYLSTTRLREGPSGVSIDFHGEYVPKSWIPPLIGPAIIEAESRKQYGEFLDEMRRRHEALPHAQ